MKSNLIILQVERRGAVVCVEFPEVPQLALSSDLPARRHVQDRGYSEKGWLWCAFQEAIENQEMKLADPIATFELIWEKVRVS